MKANHLHGYFGGTISFEESRMEEVVRALNLLGRRKAKIIVGHSTVKSGMATLPFGLKEQSSGLLSLEGEGISVDELRTIFEGCDLKCYPLKPSVSNGKHLELAQELEDLNEMPSFSLADIAPKHGTPDSASPCALSPSTANNSNCKGHAGAGEEDTDPFAGLIGLDEQVGIFKSIATAVKEYGRDSLASLNMVLTGEPGVGKSSAAQAFARYAKREGLVKGSLRQMSAENLIARYAGQTPSLVKEQWQRARGGIFLLDEAYRLSQDSGGYGQEALNTLNELMERDKETLVICAGYRKEMANFLDRNPGLTQRFAFHVDFPSYSDETLAKIFVELARTRSFAIEAAAEQALPEAVRTLKREPHFANGRSMRNLVDRCIIKQACCCKGGRTITEQALRLALAESRESSPAAGGRIGFA